MYKVGIFICIFMLVACNNKDEKKGDSAFKSVEVTTIYEDSVSIRSIEIMDGGSLAFAGSEGKFGLYNPITKVWNTSVQQVDSIKPNFRATAHTISDFFMLSIENPALLYKTGDNGRMRLVYSEENSKVFYDAMKFWNNKEGIAIGDPVDNCISILITRDAGNTWQKIDCAKLPELKEGEAAFAASNTNISIVGNKAWIITGGIHSRVYYSLDKGENWEVFETPLLQGKATQGGYSIDFYDKMTGFIIGGDYTEPELNTGNKAITQDGGITWNLVADGNDPGYKSCVQFVPDMEGEELVSVGFTGISYTHDSGNTWEELSKEGFFTLRFLNDSIAYAAGKNRIARLNFKR
ncbi:MAG: oxidoreductase [Leeuwenhoekiella sp.]